MNQKNIVNTSSAVVAVTSAVSAVLINNMVQNKIYHFICTANCWIKQANTSPTAAPATAANVYAAAGARYELSGSRGAFLAVIQDTVAGVANLWLVDEI